MNSEFLALVCVSTVAWLLLWRKSGNKFSHAPDDTASLPLEAFPTTRYQTVDRPFDIKKCVIITRAITISDLSLDTTPPVKILERMWCQACLDHLISICYKDSYLREIKFGLRSFHYAIKQHNRKSIHKVRTTIQYSYAVNFSRGPALPHRPVTDSLKWLLGVSIKGPKGSLGSPLPYSLVLTHSDNWTRSSSSFDKPIRRVLRPSWLRIPKAHHDPFKDRFEYLRMSNLSYVSRDPYTSELRDLWISSMKRQEPPEMISQWDMLWNTLVNAVPETALGSTKIFHSSHSWLKTSKVVLDGAEHKWTHSKDHSLSHSRYQLPIMMDFCIYKEIWSALLCELFICSVASPDLWLN